MDHEQECGTVQQGLTLTRKVHKAEPLSIRREITLYQSQKFVGRRLHSLSYDTTLSVCKVESVP